MDFEEVISNGKQKLRLAGISEIIDLTDLTVKVGVPGLGGAGSGITFERNRLAFKKYALKHKLLGDSFIPDTKTSVLGIELSLPILSAPMSGIKTNLNNTIAEDEFLTGILDGCRQAGTIGMCGDSFDSTDCYVVPELIKKYGGIGVCKPRKQNEIIKRIKLLEESHTKAIGIDVDGLGGIMLFSQGAVTKKGKNELEEIRKTYKGKMFLKGIMSVDDARMAHDTGFDAIVVSNHGGRVSDYSNGVADILPVIVKEMGRKIEILADGGIRTGFDAFIYLALGAKGVLVGRTSLYGVLGGGTEGVKSVMNKLSSELIRAMLFTECRTIADINIDKITRL